MYFRSYKRDLHLNSRCAVLSSGYLTGSEDGQDSGLLSSKEVLIIYYMRGQKCTHLLPSVPLYRCRNSGSVQTRHLPKPGLFDSEARVIHQTSCPRSLGRAHRLVSKDPSYVVTATSWPLQRDSPGDPGRGVLGRLGSSHIKSGDRGWCVSARVAAGTARTLEGAGSWESLRGMCTGRPRSAAQVCRVPWRRRVACPLLLSGPGDAGRAAESGGPRRCKGAAPRTPGSERPLPSCERRLKQRQG